MRLFTAITPPADVVDHLAMACLEIRYGIGSGLRWVAPEQFHLTCAFHGEIPAGAVDELVDRLRRVADTVSPLTLHLRGGAGSFAGRTLWIGVGGSTRELTEVMARCDVADHDQHDRPVRRRAHLTVARSGARSHEVDLGVLVRALSVYDGPEWTVDRLQLISSRLGEGPGGGPLHEVVDEFPFSAGHGVQSSVV